MSDSPAKLEVRTLSKTFLPGRGSVPALDGVSFTVEEGEFYCILGPSGCGKSTLFNILSGLLPPDPGGRVIIDGEDVTGRRGTLAYMPQKDLLLPWRTVLRNTLLGPEIHEEDLAEARHRALALFEQFGLKGFEHHYPLSLSGGMRQRVALLRTLLFDREIMLLDEPFGALDAMTRGLMQRWLMHVWVQLRKTILFITHDVEEAIYLSDRVLVLTARPGAVKALFEVRLPRPREYDVVTTSPFIRLKQQILGEVHDEVERAFQEDSLAFAPPGQPRRRRRMTMP